jgi:phosphoribosylanthranilate isomerase
VIRVKICGVTTVEDALLAAELGASAIGLVFWPGSPRFVEVRQARAIVAALPPFVSAVGVFVDQTGHAAHVTREVGLGAVQLHGDEPPESYRAFPAPVIKAIAVRDDSAQTAANAMEAVEAVAPYAIDVSSGVERAFGRKDPDKLRALFTALRRVG